jgi:hypothetical protein
LCEKILPDDTVNEIKYFTAKVRGRPNDPDQPVRQQTYFRALRTLPNLTIIEGTFLTQEVKMPLVTPLNGEKFALVYKTEEKGSDVNIASHLLHDGHLGRYEVAVVISNDSDLVEPIRLVVNDLNHKVGVINPQVKKPKSPSIQLQQTATFFKNIRNEDLASCQFPPEITDKKGIIYKLRSW